MRAGSKGFVAGKFLRTASLIVLALGCGTGSQALAATYLVSNETELRNAIAAANASPDASSTIVFTQSFTVTTAPNLATPTKALTIDTQGFTLSGAGASSIFFNGSFPSGSLTISGTFVGGTGSSGLVFNSGITTAGASTGQVVNNGSISGGAAASGGLGVSLINVVTFVNNGTVSGGTGTGSGVGNNGSAVNILNTGATLINNASGVIQGGNSTAGGHTGAGVYVSTTNKAATITNYGTIRGGSAVAGPGEAAIVARGASATPATIYNLGTGVIEGGNGAAAITNSNFPSTISIINSGTIRAGAGSATAISMSNQAAGVNLSLELQAGSQIIGNVHASSAGTNDVLRLGGTTDSSFDASSIGATAQYQGFDRFEKTGSSTWTLTGATTAVTPWRLVDGTLSIASDGSLGATSGALTFDGGTLRTTANIASARDAVINAAGGTFQTDADLSWSGTISGAGALNKTGNGTLVLTGGNSYAGGTTIAAGTLQLGNGGTTGSIAGDVVNSGSLAFNRSDAVTFAGTVSGSGSLQQTGGGTLTLTASNSYTGGTTISGGTLQLGNGGTTGSIVGDVTNNGTLAFNRSDDVTFAGAISGSGGVRKLGTASLTLTGANSYGGGTEITAGRLTGSAASFGSGKITNNGALIIAQSSDATLANALSGTGTFTKTGGAALNLTGDSSGFTGATTIAEGTLLVNGSLSGSAVTVASGARLGGSGTVGATTVAAGGRITPGNSIGTLTVNGAYVQNAGAVYEVEIDPRSVTSDRIEVKGTATLANGATIAVTNTTGGTFVAGQRYTILTSTGLTGTYGNTDIAVSPFLSLRNGTDATNAYISVVQTRSVGSIGNTGNEQQVGQAVDSMPAGNPVQTEVTNKPTVDAARDALGQLAGEIHASARTVLVDESWLLRAAVNDRLRSAFGAVGAAPMATLNYGFTADLAPAVKGPMPRPPSAERFAVWGQGYGAWGRTSSDGNASSISRSTGGLLVGADAAVFENLRLGVVAGYSRSSFEVNGRLSSGESDNYHLGLYGGGQFGALSLRTGLSYTWHDLSTRRSVVSAGLGDLLRADYDAGTVQAFGEFGYRIEIGQIAFEPFVGLAYVNLRSDGFTERGGAAALSSASGDTSLGYATLGLRAATTTRLSGMDLTLRGGLGWRHAFGDVDPKLTLAFAEGNRFTIGGLPIARDAALVEAGLDLALGAGVTLGASYTGQLAESAQDHAFKANLAVRF
ncbi:autotransporter domain-containing protein [Bosea sp. NPDC055332]